METINLGEADGLPAVNWTDVLAELEAGSAPAPDAHNARTTWLTTINEDGSPHVTAVGAVWMDGSFWFQTGAGTRKRRNVARDPRCSVAVSIRDADVVIEGAAAAVRPERPLTHRASLGGPRLASGARRKRLRHHRPVQRTVPRTTTVARVPRRAAIGDCRAGHRARRPDSLPILTTAQPPRSS